jgi:hypothetical protein
MDRAPSAALLRPGRSCDASRPEDHVSRLRGERTIGAAFFDKHYRYRTYRRLDDALPALVQELLTGDDGELIRTHDFWVRRDNVEQDLVIVRDIAEHDSYRIAELEVAGPVAVARAVAPGAARRADRQSSIRSPCQLRCPRWRKTRCATRPARSCSRTPT